MSTVLATVAFLLLLDTSLLSQAGITHYSQLLTLQHSTKLLFFKKSISKLIFKVPTTTSRVPPGHILTNLIINWLLDVNANRKWGKSPILRTLNRWRLPKLTVGQKFTKTKNSISLDSRYVDLENTGFSATLSYIAHQHHPYIESLPTLWYFDNLYVTNYLQINGQWVAKDNMHSTIHDVHNAVGHLTHPVC